MAFNVRASASVPDKYGFGSRKARRVGVRCHIFDTRLLAFVVAAPTLSFFSPSFFSHTLTQKMLRFSSRRVRRNHEVG